MLSNNITITAKGNRRIKLSIYSGHFATGHAHVDRYISMTEIRSNAAMAAEAADEISKFFRCTPIDTIICLENTQVIGAFIAQDLIDSSHSVNSGATVNIITPGINSNNQLVFSSDMQQYVTNRNILLLMSTVSTGRSLARAAECIRYYGGKPVGIGSIFSAVEEAAGLPVHSIFMRSESNEYNVYRSDECPLCKNGRKLDGFVTVGGCTEI